MAYADGELTGAEAAEVEQALEACERCRRELDALQRSFGALDALTAGDPAPASAARLEALEAEIRAAGAASHPAAPVERAGLLVRFPWLAPVAAAAGLLLVAGLGWSALGGGQDDLTAIRPDRPAPTVPRTSAPDVEIDETPRDAPSGPEHRGPRDTVPEARPQDEAPIAPPEAPAQQAPAPVEAEDEGPVVAEAGFDALSPDEQGLVENLELALLLADEELGQLSVEELEAVLLLQDAQDELEGWDPDELEAG
ncbi:MAG: zf-HC2 domain-containing protein [Planctomycetota bacterium]